MHAIRPAVAALAVLGLVACSPEAEQPPAPVEPSPVPETPQAPPIGYACESGQTVDVQYPDTATARLTYKGQAYELRATPSETGARYAGSGLEWLTATRDGQESATLSRLGPNEDVGVAVLERCSRPASSVIPTGPTPSDPANPLPVGAPPCRGPQLKLAQDGGDAGAGNRVALLSVQNVGQQACSVTGYPGVTLQDARGRTLTSVVAEQSPGSYFRAGETPQPVIVAPQGKAWFELAWNVVPHEGQGETTCPSAARVRMTAPGDTSPVSLNLAFTPCGGRVRVSPFTANADPQITGQAAAPARR